MALFAITGASGGGKSTLIAALSAAGHATVAEVGRQIVAEERRAGGTALPWLDRTAFMHRLFARSLAAYEAAAGMADRPVFLDRSFIEAIAYGATIGAPVPPEWHAVARRCRFADPVFVCPPWPEIYRNDEERRHDFAFAVKDHEATVAAYRAAGYRLLAIPRVTVDERVAFVLAAAGAGPTFQSAEKSV